MDQKREDRTLPLARVMGGGDQQHINCCITVSGMNITVMSNITTIIPQRLKKVYHLLGYVTMFNM